MGHLHTRDHLLLSSPVSGWIKKQTAQEAGARADMVARMRRSIYCSAPQVTWIVAWRDESLQFTRFVGKCDRPELDS